MSSIEDLFSFDFTGAAAGEANAQVVVKAEHRNMSGYMHGALPFALADSSMGEILMRRLRPEGRFCMTVEMTSRFVASAEPGETLAATPRIIHLGARSAIMEAEVRSSSGKLVLFATATFAIRDKPPAA